jgi:hypothetical protein
MTVISYPIPPYQNVPINAQYFQPSQFFISAITLGQTTTVTTTVDNNYTIGQLVRFIIPQSFGIRQLNEQEGYVLSIPNPNQVVVAIDSSFYDPFVSSSATTQPQILAAGDINSGFQNSQGRFNNGTYVPGAFINISPA